MGGWRFDRAIASGAHRAGGDIALDATTIFGTTCLGSYGHLPALERDDSLVAYADPVSVPTEVTHDVLGAAEHDRLTR